MSIEISTSPQRISKYEDASDISFDKVKHSIAASTPIASWNKIKTGEYNNDNEI